MIDKFLKIAGVNNMEDFYKLHPTEEHFFKTYPHAKKELSKKKLKKAAKGGPTNIPANLIPYFDEQMKRQGKVLLTDKGTNTTYYGTKKPDGSWDINSFEVLTGANLNENNVKTHDLDQTHGNFNWQGTPIGVFPLEYAKDIYGSPGYRLLGSSVGDGSKIGRVAYHITYKGPHDQNRAALYNNNNAQDNYRSMGCINCQKPSLDHLVQFIGNDPNISTYVVNSNLSEKENRNWFNKNTPKYVYTANSETPTLVNSDFGNTLSSVGSYIGDALSHAGSTMMDMFGLGETTPQVKPAIVARPMPGTTPVVRTQPTTPVKSPTATAPKQQPTPKKDTGSSSVQSTSRPLAKNGTEQVAQFQEFLNKQTGANLTVDGAWGPKTQAAYDMYMARKKASPALASNQYEYGGEAYSENNQSMRNKTVRRYQNAGPVMDPKRAAGINAGLKKIDPFGVEKLKKNAQDHKEMQNVKEFQMMLNKQMGTNLAVDGMWGPKTQAAYERYMGKKNLQPMEEMAVRTPESFINTGREAAPMYTGTPTSITSTIPVQPRNIIGPPTQDQWEENAPRPTYGNGPAMTPTYGSNGVQEGWSGMEYAMGGYYQNGGQNNQMQQIMQGVAQAFQQGASPEQILKSLVKQGIPQDTAMQILKMVVDQAEQGGEDEQSQPLPQESAQQTYAQGGSLPKEVLRSRLESHMSPSEAQAYLDEYAKGGIHIKPSRKGTFTAQATRMGMGVQEAARHILANKDRYSPRMVKKANFARNAAKWKHQNGGPTASHPPVMLDPYPAYVDKNGYSRMYGAPLPPTPHVDSVLYNQSHPTALGIPPTIPTRAYGGYYQEGGETMPQEQMEGAPQQAQEQAMGQEQQQGGQDQMMQQLAGMVAEALQRGMAPEQIVQMLVQQGVPQEVAVQVVQMVMQQMGGGAPQGGPGQQYQPQGGQYQGPAPIAAYGGYYQDGGFFNESYMPFDY